MIGVAGNGVWEMIVSPTTGVASQSGRILNEAVVSNAAASTINRVYRKDFSDGAGHGYLVAVDSLFVTLASALTGLTNTADLRLLYRFKEVPLAEYIGIVQSQT